MYVIHVQKIERELFESMCEFELYIRFFKFYKHGNKQLVIGLVSHIETVVASIDQSNLMFLIIKVQILHYKKATKFEKKSTFFVNY